MSHQLARLWGVPWDSAGWFTLIFKRGATMCSSITATCFAMRFLRKDLGNCNIILLCDNTLPHTANLTAVTLATLDWFWEIWNHSLYSLELVHSNFHLFGPLKEQLGEQKFNMDDELKCCVLNWLCSQAMPFCAVVSVLCHGNGKNVSL